MLTSVLDKNNLVAFGAEGDAFDPEIHEAVAKAHLLAHAEAARLQVGRDLQAHGPAEVYTNGRP